MSRWRPLSHKELDEPTATVLQLCANVSRLQAENKRLAEALKAGWNWEEYLNHREVTQ